MSSLPGRTLKNGNPPCPRCQGDRCQIFWGGEDCSLCVGGFYTWQGKQCKCKFCNNGKKRPRVLCHRDGDKWFDLGEIAEGYAPVIKPSSPRAVESRIDQVYSAFLDRCYLTDDWRDHLTKERILSDDTILCAGFVTLPPQIVCNEFAAEIAESLGAPVGVPGFYEDKGIWCFRRTLHWDNSGLVIPCRNSIGQIVMLQVRSDGDDPKRRYMCISGAPSYVSHAGTGSGAPAHWMPNNYEPVVGVTEGGLKAIRIAELWPRFGKFPVRWVGLCGLTVPSDFFDQIREHMPKTKNLLFAFDREAEGTPAWDSVERVKKLLVTGAAKAGMKYCSEPKIWTKDGARKFDDYLGGLV